jgi:hypothetical protein
MPTTITSAGITFNDATSLTSANIGTAQLVNGSVTAAKLGTTEQKQIAKAWVNFNGTLATPITPRASFNVSSVTKNGTGDYTVNFPIGTFADTNYSVVGGSGDGASFSFITPNAGTKTTTSTKIYSTGSSVIALADATIICIAAFGN